MKDPGPPAPPHTGRPPAPAPSARHPPGALERPGHALPQPRRQDRDRPPAGRAGFARRPAPRARAPSGASWLGGVLQGDVDGRTGRAERGGSGAAGTQRLAAPRRRQATRRARPSRPRRGRGCHRDAIRPGAARPTVAVLLFRTAASACADSVGSGESTPWR